MSAQLMAFHGNRNGAVAMRRADIAAHGTQMDFSTQLGKLERTLRWLDRNQIEVSAFSCSTLRGATVCARSVGKLRYLLRDELYSRGHACTGSLRIERMAARDPSTGVLITWEEEAMA